MDASNVQEPSQEELAKHAASTFLHRAKSTSAYFWTVPSGFQTTTKSAYGAFHYDMQAQSFDGGASTRLNGPPSAAYLPQPQRRTPGFASRTVADATYSQDRPPSGATNRWNKGS